MKENMRDHCKMCATCTLHRSENIKFKRKTFCPSLLPMDFICMDLIGEFYPPTSHGHRLHGFTWCIPLKTKTAEEVDKPYLDHICSLFGGSVKILMDNGTKFKNKLFKEVITKLGTEFSIHSPPFRPQSNQKIEGFHRFLKQSTPTMHWNGMNSHQWQQHATTSSSTAVQENQLSSSCLGGTQSTNST